MNKISKKCPVCHCENAAGDFFCQHCGIDISNVRAGLIASIAPSPTAAETGAKNRVCPQCSQASATILPLCSNCGFDFSVPPSKKLLLIIGNENHECKSGDVIGREGTIARNYFGALSTVSRKHASFLSKDGRWFIVVPASVQNITQLDGTELPRGVEHPLDGEHRLKLSTQCEVRLRVV